MRTAAVEGKIRTLLVGSSPGKLRVESEPRSDDVVLALDRGDDGVGADVRGAEREDREEKTGGDGEMHGTRGERDVGRKEEVAEVGRG